jgi:predicted ATPase
MYGSYSRTVDFRKDINLLVGINGSGKTTILNCIDWMLRPDFASLATISFKEIFIDFFANSKAYTLVATQTEKKMTIRETRSRNFPNPITIDFLKHPSFLVNESECQWARERYRHLGPEKAEQKLWSFLTGLNHPLTVSLDRSISAEVEDEVYLDIVARQRSAKARKQKSPLEKVKDVTRERFAKYRSEVHELNERLKTKLVISAFSRPFFNNDVKKPQVTKKVSLEEIAKLERRVSLLLAASLGGDDASSHIQAYFSGAKEFAQHVQKNQRLLEVFWSQYRQIDELTKAFDEYEKSASAAYESLGSYLKSVNAFFVDSKKHVFFDDSDGNLDFNFIDNDIDSREGSRPLERLSSGERQILILLTFLAFVTVEEQVFIVDEPELSLHPKWQSYFVDAIVSLAPVGTQVIMATHSPEIVGRHRQYCVVLDSQG